MKIHQEMRVHDALAAEMHGTRRAHASRQPTMGV